MNCLDIKMVCSIQGNHQLAGSLLERGTAFTSTHTMVALYLQGMLPHEYKRYRMWHCTNQYITTTVPSRS